MIGLKLKTHRFARVHLSLHENPFISFCLIKITKNAVSVIERNGAEACTIFKIKIHVEKYARGDGFSLISSRNIYTMYMEHFQEI